MKCDVFAGKNVTNIFLLKSLFKELLKKGGEKPYKNPAPNLL
jgi:hypothetical protein